MAEGQRNEINSSPLPRGIYATSAEAYLARFARPWLKKRRFRPTMPQTHYHNARCTPITRRPRPHEKTQAVSPQSLPFELPGMTASLNIGVPAAACDTLQHPLSQRRRYQQLNAQADSVKRNTEASLLLVAPTWCLHPNYFATIIRSGLHLGSSINISKVRFCRVCRFRVRVWVS